MSLPHRIGAILLTVASSVLPAGAEPPAPPPGARASDVASVDAILAALYDVISGPAGQKRDWDRMRALFVDGGRLIAIGHTPAGEFTKRMMTVEDYIRTSGPFLEEKGFTEHEIARRVEQFGGVVHVFSTYEGRIKADDPKPFVRGINSIQLMNDGTRWWVVTVFWEAESAANPLPEQYLK